MGTTIPTINEVIQPYSVTPVLNSTTFPEDIDTYNGEQPSRITSKNTANTQANAMATAMNTVRDEVQENADATETNALIAKGAANFQGDWVSDTLYTVGQSVYYNSTFYVCKVENSDAIWTETNWRVNVPLGAVGNISSPLLDLPLNNSLAMKQGVGSVTFTRATTATYIDRYGVLQYSAIDEARFEKDGFLVEGASTNLLPNSSDLENNTYWTGTASITANNTEAPDGTLTADKVEDNNISATDYRYSDDALITSGVATYSLSCFIKKGTSQYSQIEARLGGGTQVATTVYVDFDNKVISSDASGTAKLEEFSNEWFRVSMQVTDNNSGNTYARALIRPATLSSTSDITLVGYTFAWGFQIEELPFASSYIPTTTAAVTRSADVETQTAYGNIPSNIEGSIKLDFSLLSHYEAYSYIFGCYEDSLNNIRCFVSAAGYLTVRSNSATGGATTANLKLINTNQEYRLVVTWKDNIINVYLDGVLSFIQTWVGDLFDSDLINTPIRIGGYSTTSATLNGNGHYKNFRTYSKALTPTEVALA